EDKIDMKRRMLMEIQTSDNTSYTFDLQRLKGGTVHENFFRASEDEDCTLTTELPTEEVDSTLQQYVKSLGKEGGLASSETLITTEKTAKGGEDFNFTWTGDRTGTSVNMFIKGVKDSNIAFSKMPTLRRTYNDPEVKDKFPNWHYYQRADVTPDDISQFGGVYEGVKAGAKASVVNSDWIDIDSSSKMTSLTKVSLADGSMDYIYVSDDDKEREYDDITFGGKIVVIRIKDGNPVWSYIYGNGTLKYKDTDAVGQQEFTYPIVASQGSLNGSIDNKVQIKGVINKDIDLKGLYVFMNFGDGSGIGNKVEKFEQSEIWVRNDPGFEVSNAKAKMVYFPSKYDPDAKNYNSHALNNPKSIDRVIKGDVTLTVKIPTFTKY
ncbi:MAG: hypothetical protein RR145_05115, partial [Oscillospiraceae bacterium]